MINQMGVLESISQTETRPAVRFVENNVRASVASEPRERPASAPKGATARSRRSFSVGGSKRASERAYRGVRGAKPLG